MKYDLRILALLLSVLFMGSCNVIAGEPGSESQVPPLGPSYFYDRYVEGQPNVDFSIRDGFFIWKTGDSWHVRVATIPHKAQVMPAGPVVTGSVFFENAMSADVKRYKINPPSNIRYVNKQIDFEFDFRRDNVVGFDFRTQPLGVEYCVTFDFRFEGIPPAGLVYLGSMMYQPNTLPLKICVHR